MIAHFVGGPLNGTERALEEGSQEIEVYELDRPRDEFGREKFSPEAVSIPYTTGKYRLLPAHSLTRDVPAIFVWMDERPFKIVVTVDAVPGASREVAREVLQEVTHGLGDYHRAFTGGLLNFTVER